MTTGVNFLIEASVLVLVEVPFVGLAVGLVMKVTIFLLPGFVLAGALLGVVSV